ncbi:flavin-containing monooxygenase [Rhodococcus sp. WAY2]|uniref:flavin-containing monooxygenase n=1 Tax=Rhodococcus sp. WAY2 TaxID=2663121 RepID=UPI00131FFFD6|nr:NAD(P)/FAD-dependent oxidoreductase [Rhodococcus sp. WAY2]QHE74251.1 Cyclohexanone monooxygenase [Rhodococcus sp. WAY2]
MADVSYVATATHAARGGAMSSGTTSSRAEFGSTSPGPPSDVRIAVIGAGFSGLGMAIRLKQAGVEDFVVLERGDAAGGTWHYNTYPGCGCDMPSHLYSFSFAPNPNWSRTYSTQPEIGSYLRDCVRRFEIERHIVFGCEITGATWDDAQHRWNINTTRGAVSAPLLIAATGPLTEPPGAGAARTGNLRRRHLPLRTVESRPRPDRREGGIHRHRSLGHPVRARHHAAGATTVYYYGTA